MVKTIAIIGGGQAGAQVILHLRRLGFKGAIALFSDEPELPYQRPPLSKAFLAGEMDEARLLFRKQAFYDEQNIDLHLAESVCALLPATKQIETAKQKYSYDLAVLATGGSPRQLATDKPVLYLHNKAEAEALAQRFATAKEIAIIGGGYIGLEVAATARKRGLEVRLFEGEARILSRVAAAEVSHFFTTTHEKHGVEFFLHTKKSGAGDKAFASALVLGGIGMAPHVSLAQQAGLAIDNGICVNEQQQTTDASIYAIGDCARAPHALYGEALRLESVQNANYQAVIAAHAICARPPPPIEVPWFWSDQYDIKLQIAGLSQGYDRTLLRGSIEKGSFVLFYIAKDKVVAADCINRPQEFLFVKKALTERRSIPLAKLADDSLSAKEIF